MGKRTKSLCLLAAFFWPFSASGQETLPIKATHVYPVKFTCGTALETFQEGVVRGVHATSISLHNPSTIRAVSFAKRVARALPFQRSDAGSERIVDTLQPQTSIDIECNEIRMMLPASMTTQFRTGFLTIHSTGELNVVAVYSSRPRDGDVSTIDVEMVKPRKVKADEETGDQPDLVIGDIDLSTLRVRCPTGAGSCRAAVTVIVENTGTAASGPFTLRTTFDPRQSINSDDPVGGLGPGETKPVNVNVTTGGNCFDPDCQICAMADSKDVVEESDEENNDLCREKQG